MNLIETKDKNKTVTIDNITLHSKYSPIKEAEKFIRNKINNFQTVIVLGPGLGYMHKVFERDKPETKVISIPYTKELGDLSLKLNKTNRIQWDNTESIDTFINKNITQENLKGIEIIEWEPTAKLYKDISLNINSKIAARIRRINGNIISTANFGKLWLKNSIKNFLLTDNYISDITILKPVIIVAPGKSLEQSLNYLKEIRERVAIFSLSSAVMALKNSGIEPDIIFSTDGGYYSKLHLKYSNSIISMPLSNSNSYNRTTLLLNQGNFFEKELIKLGEIPSFKVNENGTVAGTALEFALRYSKGVVYLLGQDLESSDINSHIEPYAFDNLLKKDTNRTNPYYSVKCKRFYNSGYSLKTYKDWFEYIGKTNPGRVVRINSLTNKIKWIDDIKPENIANIFNKVDTPGITYKIVKAKPVKERENIINELLNSWIRSLHNEEIEENPLFYLISTTLYTDVCNKASDNVLKNKLICESDKFLKGLLLHYGKQLFQQQYTSPI